FWGESHSRLIGLGNSGLGTIPVPRFVPRGVTPFCLTFPCSRDQLEQVTVSSHIFSSLNRFNVIADVLFLLNHFFALFHPIIWDCPSSFHKLHQFLIIWEKGFEERLIQNLNEV